MKVVRQSKKKKSMLVHMNKSGRRSEHEPEIYLAGLASRVGVSESHISRIFRGEKNPSLDVAARIAHELGISLDELMRKLRRIKSAA